MITKNNSKKFVSLTADIYPGIVFVSVLVLVIPFALIFLRTTTITTTTTADAAVPSYRCQIHASYIVVSIGDEDDDDEVVEHLPTPTPSERNWVADQVKLTYNSVHHDSSYDCEDNFEMPLVKYVSLQVSSITADTNHEEEPPQNATTTMPFNLRRRTQRRRGPSTQQVISSKTNHGTIHPPNTEREYRYHLTSIVSQRKKKEGGNNKKNDFYDDDGEAEEGAVAVVRGGGGGGGTIIHTQWVTTWCQKLQQGGIPMFQNVSSCAITLSPCTIMRAGSTIQ